MSFLKKHRIEVWLFVFALLVRLIVFGVDLSAAQGNLIATVRGDDSYYEISQNLVTGHGYSADTAPPYVPNSLRTPGYLYFLWAILAATGSYALLTLIQLLMGAAVPLLARRVVLAFLDSPAIALAVGILLALEPTFIMESFVFAVETLFLLLFFPFLLLFLRYLKQPTLPLLLGSSLLLALSTIVKPTVEYLPIVLAFFIIYACWNLGAKRILTHLALGALVFLAVLAPWFYRNYETFGVVALSSQAPYALYIYLAPSALALEQGIDFNTEFATFSTVAERSGDAITLANAGVYKAKALAIIFMHPEGLVLSAGTTVIDFFTLDGGLAFLQHAGYGAGARLPRPAATLLFTHPVELFVLAGKYATSPLVLVLILRVAWVIATIAFLAGALIYVRRRGWTAPTLLLLLLVAYFAVTSIPGGLGATPRYRMPVDPIILAFAILGLGALAKKLRERLPAYNHEILAQGRINQ